MAKITKAKLNAQNDQINLFMGYKVQAVKGTPGNWVVGRKGFSSFEACNLFIHKNKMTGFYAAFTHQTYGYYESWNNLVYAWSKIYPHLTGIESLAGIIISEFEEGVHECKILKSFAAAMLGIDYIVQARQRGNIDKFKKS